MTGQDHDIDALLRASRPDYAAPGAPLSQRAESDLRALVGESDLRALVGDGSVRARTRRRRVGWLSAAASALVVAAVATVAALAAPAAPSQAATPPLPHFAPVTGAAAPLLEGLAARAEADSSPGRPAGEVRYESWVLDTQVEGAAHVSTFIQPQITTVSHDGKNATVVIRAGRPYDTTGAPVDADGSAPPDEVLSEYATELPVPEPPADVDAWPGYLQSAFGVATDAEAGEVLLQLSSVLDFWNPSPAQTAALLRYVATLPGLEIEGSTTDRLGRDGIVFMADPVGADWRPSIFIDPQTGRILAVQTTYVGATRTDIPSPAIIEYTLWK